MGVGLVIPPPTVDEALAAYATAVADVIHTRRNAEITAKAFQEARRIDDIADKKHQEALSRLASAAQEVDKAQQRAIDGEGQPIGTENAAAEEAPKPEPELDEDDVIAYEYAWMNGAMP